MFQKNDLNTQLSESFDNYQIKNLIDNKAKI